MIQSGHDLRHVHSAGGIVVSPGGLVATHVHDDGLQIWSLRDRGLLRRIPGAPPPFAWTRNDHLIVGDRGQALRELDVTGRVARTSTVLFAGSRPGKAGGVGVAQLLTTSLADPARAYLVRPQPLVGVADGYLWASAGLDTIAPHWFRWPDTEVLDEATRKGTHACESLEISSDGSTVVCAGKIFDPDGDVQRRGGITSRLEGWRLKDGQPFKTFSKTVEGEAVVTIAPDANSVTALLSPDGTFATTTSLHWSISGEELPASSDPRARDSEEPTWTAPDGRRVGFRASADGGSLIAFDTMTGGERFVMGASQRRASTVSFTDDHTLRVSFAEERPSTTRAPRRLHVQWDLTTLSAVAAPPERAIPSCHLEEGNSRYIQPQRVGRGGVVRVAHYVRRGEGGTGPWSSVAALLPREAVKTELQCQRRVERLDPPACTPRVITMEPCTARFRLDISPTARWIAVHGRIFDESGTQRGDFPMDGVMSFAPTVRSEGHLLKLEGSLPPGQEALLSNEDISYGSHAHGLVFSADETRVAVPRSASAQDSRRDMVSTHVLPSGKELVRVRAEPRRQITLLTFSGSTGFITHDFPDPSPGPPDVSASPSLSILRRFEGEHEVRRVERGLVGGQAALSPTGDRLALASDGRVTILDAHHFTERVTLVSFDDGEHVAFTPNGAYTGSAEAASRVGWLFGTTRLATFEQYSATYNRPEIVRAHLNSLGPDLEAVPPSPPALDLRAPVRLEGRTARIPIRTSSPRQVRYVQAYVEGRIAGSPVSICAASAEVDITVPVRPGVQRVTLAAFDAQGFSSTPLELDVTGPGTEDAQGALFTMAFGVSRYPHLPTRFQLDFADDDARGIARAVTARAAKDGTYKTIHAPIVLTDESASPDAIRAALSKLATMQPEDVAIVFFAGHGLKTSADGDMMFVTSGLRAVELSARLTPDPDTLARNTVRWGDIAGLLRAARGRVVVLLDACHSGHVTQELVVPNAALAESLVVSERSGVIVFSAAKGRQQSYEPAGARGLSLVERADAAETAGATRSSHGFFTEAILRALDAPESVDANRDGHVQISELVRSVTHDVHERTLGSQTPWVARRELFGDFSLFGRRTVGAPTRVVRPQRR